MTDNWKSIGAAAKQAIAHLKQPTYFEVPLQPDVANTLIRYCGHVNQSPETIIAEATAAYMGVDV